MGALKSHRHASPRSSRYEAAEAKHVELEATYSSLARLIGCESDELAVVSSATAAWQQVIYGENHRSVLRMLC
jgi:cysteine desulfurase/selenocysteine lyase